MRPKEKGNCPPDDERFPTKERRLERKEDRNFARLLTTPTRESPTMSASKHGTADGGHPIHWEEGKD